MTLGVVLALLMPTMSTTSVPPPVAPPIYVPPPAPPSPYDPNDHSRPPRARMDARFWVTTDDYPSSAQREEAEGVTEVELTVGVTGRVGVCGIRRSSGTASLDHAACRNLLRRARYEPALGYDGQPEISVVAKRVRWELPDDEPVGDVTVPPPNPNLVSPSAQAEAARLPLPRALNDLSLLFYDQTAPAAPEGYVRYYAYLRLEIDTNGSVSACAPVSISYAIGLDVSAVNNSAVNKMCAKITRHARFRPALNQSGVPVPSVVYSSGAEWIAAPPPSPPSPPASEPLPEGVT